MRHGCLVLRALFFSVLTIGIGAGDAWRCLNSGHGPVGTERWEQYKARWAPELARNGYIVDWHPVQQRGGITIQKKSDLRFRVTSRHGWNLDL